MPTIYDTRNQQDQKPIEIAWKELVDHKGFELAWRVVECRLAQEAVQDLGYVPKWLGGPGPSLEVQQRLRERRWEQNHTTDLITVRPEVLQELVADSEEPHVSKWIDALFQTLREQCTNGRETPEFLRAIFHKGVADEISKREALLSSGSLFVRACKYLESVRDRVKLEAHKLGLEAETTEARKLEGKQNSEKKGDKPSKGRCQDRDEIILRVYGENSVAPFREVCLKIATELHDDEKKRGVIHPFPPAWEGKSPLKMLLSGSRSQRRKPVDVFRKVIKRKSAKKRRKRSPAD